MADVEAKKTAVNKPSDSPLKQQKLKAWQPILTAGTVLPFFIGIAVIFIPLGVILLMASNSVYEHIYDYTDCEDIANPGQLCKDHDTYSSTECRCKHSFAVLEALDRPAYVYYGLSNFYQNHRRYVKSRDDRQLLGYVREPGEECGTFRYFNQSPTVRFPIVPCGAIANSMFNDTFYMEKNEKDSVGGVPFSFKGIAWPSDVNNKFANPANEADFNGTAKPFNWRKPITQMNNKLQNESFIVWMRIAALPSFRKMYARIDEEASVSPTRLQRGNYTVYIIYNYPVHAFGGRKRFIISTTSWAGGKNHFLGYAYIIVGCICLMTGLTFLFIHLKYGKSLTEMANVHR
uniref:Cell cycle control protein n=1 Tax=Romanomermis culicivorax TaxID=13658 RepID=A0A915I804_ROMCU